jgi:hypothetical protein
MEIKRISNTSCCVGHGSAIFPLLQATEAIHIFAMGCKKINNIVDSK